MDGLPRATEEAAALAAHNQVVVAAAAAPAAIGVAELAAERTVALPMGTRVAVAHTAAAPAAAGAHTGPSCSAPAAAAGAGPDAPRAVAAVEPGSNSGAALVPGFRSGSVLFCHNGTCTPIPDPAVRGVLTHAAPTLRFRVAFDDGTTNDMDLEQVLTACVQAGAPRGGGSVVEECLAELAAARQSTSRNPRPRSAAAAAVAQQLDDTQPMPPGLLSSQETVPPPPPVLRPGAVVPPRKFRGLAWCHLSGGCWHARIRENNQDKTVRPAKCDV